MPKISIEKSTTINAPVDKVYATVRDLPQWRAWSPWLIADPECKVTFADDGRGYTWDGKILGAGEMEIIDEQDPTLIHYRLTMRKPWKSESAVTFRFSERDGGSEATWSMEGSAPPFLFFMKTMMTAVVGMDYERGLAMLKAYVETGAAPSRLEFPGLKPFPGCQYVGVSTQCPIPELGKRMGESLGTLQSWLQGAGLEGSGPPFSIYHKWSPGKGLVEFTTGVPLRDAPDEVPDGFVRGEIPACRVYPVRHTGSYSLLGSAWSAGIMHARAGVFAKNNKIHPFEIYESDPHDTPPEEAVTVVHFAAK